MNEPRSIEEALATPSYETQVASMAHWLETKAQPTKYGIEPFCVMVDADYALHIARMLRCHHRHMIESRG